MKIALAQTNSTVGDLCGNAKRILEFSRRAAEAGANVVVFPELSLTGYPPRDLLEKSAFITRVDPLAMVSASGWRRRRELRLWPTTRHSRGIRAFAAAKWRIR